MKQLIRKILREHEEEITNVSPKELYEILEYISNDMELLAKSEILGKKLRITGDLDLSKRKNITSLGNIVEVMGNLDVSNTNIQKIDGVKISGNLDISYSKISSLEGVIVGKNVTSYGSELWKINERRKKQRLFDEAEERRNAKEWDLDNSDIDEIGLRANAVIKFISHNNLTEVKTEDDYETLNVLKAKLERLNTQLERMEADGDNTNDIEEEIQEVEDAIDKINEKIDQYDLIPHHNYYDMSQFKIFSGELYDEEFIVGSEEEFDSATTQYITELIKSEGIKMFGQRFLERNIDATAIEELASEIYNNIYDEPEYYFDEDDYELSDELQEKLDNIETLIDDYESEQRIINRERATPDWEEKYDVIQEKLDELYEQKEDIESQKGITQEMIESKINEKVDWATNNPLSFLNEYEYDLKKYIDTEALIEDVKDSYNTSEWFNMKNELYDIFNIEGNNYYVFQTY
jgi:outer membrane protein OmpA-like peptidoglycan-associated protein